MTDLGTFGGRYSQAQAINRAGEVVGGADTATGAYHAFLYTGTAISDLGTLGGFFSGAYGINNAGEVVGQADTATGRVPRVSVHGNGHDRPGHPRRTR